MKYKINFVVIILMILSNVFAEQWKGLDHARAQIKKHRMADLTIKVVDGNGKAVKGVDVNVEMVRHSFPFGAAISGLSAFTEDGPNPEMEKYLSIFKENFNSAVMENAMKWAVMINDDGTRDEKKINKMWQCFKWLEENDIELRGHNAIWPSWRNSPDYLHDLRFKPEPIRVECEKRIDSVISMFKGKLTDWDLINEPAEHRDIINILGEDVMIDWYKQASAIDPETPMYVNQWAVLNGVFHKSFHKWVTYMIENKDAKLGGIGLQGHATVEQFTESDQLESVWSILDDYREFNLPIKITEFDVEGIKGEDKQAQALENALTLFFSHPSVAGFTVWGFWDGRHWRNSEKWSLTGENEYAGFWQEDWTEKEAAKTWKRLVFKEWWTNETGTTNKKAIFKIRGFIGDYKITVNNKTVTVTLQADGTKVTIKLD